MPQARQRVWLHRFFIGALVVIGGYGLTTLVVGFVLKDRIEKVAASLGAVVISTDHRVAVGLLSRSVDIHGLELGPGELGSDNHLTGVFDTIEVRGLSIWKWIRRNTIDLGGLSVRTTDLHIARCDRAEKQAGAPTDPPLEHISIGSFTIEMVRSTAMFAAGEGGEVVCGRFQLTGDRVELDLSGSDVLSTLRTVGVELLMNEVQWHTDAAQRYTVSEFSWSERTQGLAMHKVGFGPVEEPVEYSRHLREERDVIKGTVEQVLVRGLDLVDLPSAAQWRIAHVDLSHGDLLVLRDKELPDGPVLFKPLLARLVRKFAVNAGVDTIQLHDMDIRYHERAAVERGYGKLHFADLQGLITGAVHDTTAAGVLRIVAQCAVQERAAIDFTFSTVIKDTTDVFELKAHVAGLGLDELNGVLGPLANIQATAGRMDTLILTMRGDNDRASGNVRFVYTGLRLAQGHRPAETTQGSIGSRLINLIVRRNARDPRGAVRDGGFTLTRRKDRSMFNYLWLGLREGASNVLLPDVLTR